MAPTGTMIAFGLAALAIVGGGNLFNGGNTIEEEVARDDLIAQHSLGHKVHVSFCTS